MPVPPLYLNLLYTKQNFSSYEISAIRTVVKNKMIEGDTHYFTT